MHDVPRSLLYCHHYHRWSNGLKTFSDVQRAPDKKNTIQYCPFLILRMDRLAKHFKSLRTLIRSLYMFIV